MLTREMADLSVSGVGASASAEPRKFMKVDDSEDEDDEDDEVEAAVQGAIRQEEGSILRRQLANSSAKQLGIPTDSKRRLSVARWKLATTEVKKEVSILTSLLKSRNNQLKLDLRRVVSFREKFHAKTHSPEKR